jgi:hypothetical protein
MSKKKNLSIVNQSKVIFFPSLLSPLTHTHLSGKGIREGERDRERESSD